MFFEVCVNNKKYNNDKNKCFEMQPIKRMYSHRMQESVMYFLKIQLA